jgi:hypothetical protein
MKTKLTTFFRNQNRTKNIRVPPLIFTKKILLNFEKQYTYLINLKYIHCLKFATYNITLLFFTKNKIEKNLNQS